MKKILLAIMAGLFLISSTLALEIKKDATPVIYTVMVNSTDGYTPVTGVTAPLVWYIKQGGAATNLTTPTWAELDATNMTGLYSLALTAAMTDTVGDLVVYVKKTDCRDFRASLNIVANLESDTNTLAVSTNTTLAAVSGTLNATNGNLTATNATIKAMSVVLNNTNANLSAANTTITSISGITNTTNATLAAVSGVLNNTNINVTFANTTIASVSGIGNSTNATVASISGITNTSNATIAAVSTKLNTTNSTVALISTNLNVTNTTLAAVSTVLNTTNSTASNLNVNVTNWNSNVSNMNANVSAVKAKTDSLTFTTANKVDARVFTVDDKTGYSLASADYQNISNTIWANSTRTLTSSLSASDVDLIWNEVQSGHTTAGTFGKYLDAQVSTVGGGSLTVADIWNYDISGYTTAGFAGTYLKSAAAAGDPWSTDVSSGYIGQAGAYMRAVYNSTNGVKEGASYTGIENMIRSNR